MENVSLQLILVVDLIPSSPEGGTFYRYLPMSTEEPSREQNHYLFSGRTNVFPTLEDSRHASLLPSVPRTTLPLRSPVAVSIPFVAVLSSGSVSACFSGTRHSGSFCRKKIHHWPTVQAVHPCLLDKWWTKHVRILGMCETKHVCILGVCDWQC